VVQAQSRGKGAVGGGDGGGVLEEQVQSRYRAGTEQVQSRYRGADKMQNRCREGAEVLSGCIGAEWVQMFSRVGCAGDCAVCRCRSSVEQVQR
jgi:hypothetical protein